MSKRHDTLRERVKERVEEQGTEQVLPELPPDAADEALLQENPVSETLPGPGSTPAAQRTLSWLRLAYSFEFLLALLVILTLWSEVGGQGHLDMMPWYTKFGCLLASAWCSVRLTAGLVEERKVWNRRTLVWLSGLILVAITMATITYYYHLHEEQDQRDSDETTATAMFNKPSLFKE